MLYIKEISWVLLFVAHNIENKILLLYEVQQSFSKMNLTEFSQSKQNPKMVWLLVATDISKKYITSISRYPLWTTTPNRYHLRDSHGNIFQTTKSGNVDLSIVKYGVSLVTILLMNFFWIHWIWWIQWKSFRKKLMWGVRLKFRPGFWNVLMVQIFCNA